MLYRVGVFSALLLCFTGCGRKPLQKADDILFSVPYIAKEQTYEKVYLGIKRLSTPEVQELFCATSDLLRKYHVLYLRLRNRNDQPIFLNVLNKEVAGKKEITKYFEPHSTFSSSLPLILPLPISFGLSMIFKDPIVFPLSLVGMSIGMSVLEEKVLGAPHYQKLMKKVLCADVEKGVPGITLQPGQYSHYLLFTHKTDPNSLFARIAVSGKKITTKEVEFDLSLPYAI